MEWSLKVIAKSFLKVVSHESQIYRWGWCATLKRHAMKKCAINNGKEFCNAVKNSNIQVTMMNICKLQKYSVQHFETIFKNAIPIPGITGFHFIQFTDNGYLRLKLDDSDCKEIVNAYNEL